MDGYPRVGGGDAAPDERNGPPILVGPVGVTLPLEVREIL